MNANSLAKKCSISTTNLRIKANFILPMRPNDYHNKYLNNDGKITQSTIEKHIYENDEPYYIHLGLEKNKRVKVTYSNYYGSGFGDREL